MPRLIISADIHGNYNSWLTIRALLRPKDSLAIAGDLFDTRYGSVSNPDFDPQAIRKEIKSLNHPLFYVYGNCDIPSFFPGYDSQISFTFHTHKIMMSHISHTLPSGIVHNIIIQGHTHIAALEKKDGIIRLNPGSITSPRNGLYTYGVLTGEKVFLMDLETGRPLHSLTI